MLTAREIMTRKFPAVRAGQPVQELARILAGEGVSGAVVVDGEGGLLGVVTESDLVAKEQNIHLPTLVNLFGSLIYLESSSHLKEEVKRLAATTVGDIAVRDPFTITPDATLSDIASLMTENGAHFLPVMEGKKVVGIVSRREIIRALASPA